MKATKEQLEVGIILLNTN